MIRKAMRLVGVWGVCEGVRGVCVGCVGECEGCMLVCYEDIWSWDWIRLCFRNEMIRKAMRLVGVGGVCEGVCWWVCEGCVGGACVGVCLGVLWGYLKLGLDKALLQKRNDTESNAVGGCGGCVWGGVLVGVWGVCWWSVCGGVSRCVMRIFEVGIG